MNDITLITYQNLLTKLKTNQPNHLLLGNGFNNSLGIKTNYPEIFTEMKKEYSGYADVENYIKEDSHDIEKLIAHLKKQIKIDNSFLEHYIEKKVKLDFMKATNEIVQKNIKNVYQDNNQGIHLLLKNFSNYFTLNYDPFLYLLLLKFKKDDSENNEGNALVLQNTFSFTQDDLDTHQNQIYSKIKEAKEKGKLGITVGDNTKNVKLKKITKGQFTSAVKIYFKEEDWKGKDIVSVCDKIWKEEKNQQELKVNDGFLFTEFEENHPQNLYFLHGSFHIIKNKNSEQKITSEQNKTFCKRLEEAIHNENKDIICVFTNKSENKQIQINQSPYLKKCFEQLSNLNGSLVILGSSLANNDEHIFNQIKNSSVDSVYISSCEKRKKEDFKRVSQIFDIKKVTLFDYNTISYSTDKK